MAERMQIKQHEPRIETSNIWKEDKLESEKFAGRLTGLVQGQTEPLTIALNGAWGSGKTFLLKRWCADLKEQGHTAIYFNAWEDDHLDDPLVAIIGQLWLELKGSSSEEVWAGMKEACFPLIKGTALTTAKNWIQIATGISLPDNYEKILKSAAEATCDDYLNLTSARDNLRQRLRELANKVYGKGSFPLIVIVDELDRCRPTFAISVLERIKHLFNIQHIVFVLGIDREQLGKSIKSIYGEIDVDNYLHRFIDLDMNMQVAHQEEYIKALWERYQIEKILRAREQTEQSDIKLNESNTFRRMFISISKYHHLSLREIEQILKVFAMIQNSISERHFIWPNMLVVLLMIKMRFRELYPKFIEGEIPPNKISDILFPEDYDREHLDFQFLEITLYASYVSEFPNTQERSPILSLLEDAKNGNVQNNELASKRLKKLNSNDLQQFADFVTDRSARLRGNISYYDAETVKNLHRLVDMISM